jgi:hypothetical protein
MNIDLVIYTDSMTMKYPFVDLQIRVRWCLDVFIHGSQTEDITKSEVADSRPSARLALCVDGPTSGLLALIIDVSSSMKKENSSRWRWR